MMSHDDNERIYLSDSNEFITKGELRRRREIAHRPLVKTIIVTSAYCPTCKALRDAIRADTLQCPRCDTEMEIIGTREVEDGLEPFISLSNGWHHVATPNPDAPMPPLPDIPPYPPFPPDEAE